MALKVFDGTSHYKQQADILSRTGSFLQYTVNGFSEIIGPGRNGKGFWLHSVGLFGAWIRLVWGARNQTFTIGMALKAGGSDAAFRYVDSVANVYQFTIFMQVSTGRIEVHNGSETGTLIFRSANGVWNNNVDNYVEFKTTVSTTVGSIDMLLNGVEVPGFPLTGLNIQSSANAWSDTLELGTSAAGPTDHAFTDVYYCDTATDPGTYPNNGFLIDPRVATLFVVGNDSVTWSPNPNTNANWQNLVEAAMDSDSTYNSTGTPGNEDRFNFQAMPGLVTAIFGVQAVGAYRKDDAGLRQVKQAFKSGTTEVYGSVWNMPDTNYAYFIDLLLLNPDTSTNWDDTTISAIKAGYNLVA